MAAAAPRRARALHEEVDRVLRGRAPDFDDLSALQRRFEDFGTHLGVAFQAADDLPGIWGDLAVTDTPAGADLLAPKQSAPVVAALAASVVDRDHRAHEPSGRNPLGTGAATHPTPALGTESLPAGEVARFGRLAPVVRSVTSSLIIVSVRQ